MQPMTWKTKWGLIHDRSHTHGLLIILRCTRWDHRTSVILQSCQMICPVLLSTLPGKCKEGRTGGSLTRFTGGKNSQSRITAIIISLSRIKKITEQVSGAFYSALTQIKLAKKVCLKKAKSRKAKEMPHIANCIPLSLLYMTPCRDQFQPFKIKKGGLGSGKAISYI